MSIVADLDDAARAAHADQLRAKNRALRDIERLLRGTDQLGWIRTLEDLVLALSDTVLAGQLRASLAARQYSDLLADISAQTIDLAVDPAAILTDPRRAIDIMREPAATLAASTTTTHRIRQKVRLLRIAASMVHDAGTQSAAIGRALNPRVQQYVRTLTPPSCPRCAVLAGKVFSWRAVFKRHPQCDCTARALIAGIDTADDHLYDVRAAYLRGDITRVTQAERDAIADGADPTRVFNAAATGKPLPTTAGNGKTVDQILTTNRSRRDVITDLDAHGYLTAA